MDQQNEANGRTQSATRRPLRRSTQLAVAVVLVAATSMALVPHAHSSEPVTNAAAGATATPVVTAAPVVTQQPTATPDASAQAGSPAPSPISSPAPVSTPRPITPVSAAAVPSQGRQIYDLTARLDYAASTLGVRETLQWTNTADVSVGSLDLTVIPAHVGAFQLTDPVTTDGSVVEARFEQFDTDLHIPFARPVAPGSQVNVVVPFTLSVARNAGALGGRLTNQGGTIQFGEWFPIWSTHHGFSDIGEPQLTWNADAITLDLTSTTDLGIDAVASSGELQPGASASHWLFVAHNVRDFAFAVNPDYSVVTGSVTCDGHAVDVRSYSQHVPAATLLRSAITALNAFDGSFGCYPYSTFSLAEVGSPWFSMEFPMMVFIGARVATSAAVIYHEVAHQWWYGIVGNDQMNEPWLDEAFAEFSAQMLSSRVKSCSSGAVSSSVYVFSSWSPCGQYVQTVYERGADFLWALRSAMGDDAFFAAMRSIVDTYRYGIATTSGVLNIFQRQSDVDLSQILEAYGFVTAVN